MNQHAFAQADPRWLKLISDARAWLEGPVGRVMQDQGQRLLNEELARFFGGYLVHYGPSAMAPEGATQIKCSLSMGAPLPGVQVACDEQAWPLGEHAADVVVLEHGLDFSLSPHALLREAARSVRPGGHLLIVGINPLSAWGMRHLFARDALGSAQCISHGRVTDWLRLLGFSLEKRQFGCYRPPLSSLAWQARLLPLERWGGQLQAPGAGCYVLVARKTVAGLRPVRPIRRESIGKLLPMPVAKVSRRDAEP
mgnify:FL=1